nr:hypothetical protein [Planctomycetota bacterium]
PFSKVFYLVGEPITVPENLSRDQLNDYTELVQEKMEDLERELKHLISDNTVEEIVSFKKAA